MVFFVGLPSPKSCLKKLTNWRLYELLDSVCYKTLPILYVIFLLQQINILNSKLICEEWAILKQGCTQGSSAPKWNGLDVNDTLMSSKRVKDLLLSTQKNLLVVNIFSPKPIFFLHFLLLQWSKSMFHLNLKCQWDCVSVSQGLWNRVPGHKMSLPLSNLFFRIQLWNIATGTMHPRIKYPIPVA